MTSIKEVFDELGGGRSVAIVSVVFAISYVASSQYVASVEKRLDEFGTRIIVNEMFRERTSEYRKGLERRVQALEVLAREYERNNHK